MCRILILIPLLLPPFAFAIPNGIEVAPGQNLPVDMSSIVQLDLNSPGQPGSGKCTGTIISINPPLILTARHCTEDQRGSRNVLSMTFRNGGMNPTRIAMPRVKKIHHDGPRRRADKDDYSVIELSNLTDIPLGAKAAAFPKPADCPIVSEAERTPFVAAGQGGNEVKWKLADGDDFHTVENVQGVGTLRYGFNRALAVQNGLITFNGFQRNDPASVRGALVGVAPGDSGGPLYVKKNGKTYVAGIHKHMARQLIRTPNGQLNAAVDTCGREVQAFVSSILTPPPKPKTGRSRSFVAARVHD